MANFNLPVLTLNQRKNIVLGIIIALGLFLAYTLQVIFLGILGSVILYTLLKPLYMWMSEKHGLGRSLSALLIIVLSFLIIVLPFFALILMIVNKVGYYRNNPELMHEIVDKFLAMTNSKMNHEELVGKVMAYAETWVLGTFKSFINTALDTLLQVAVMYFLLFFMLKNHSRFEAVLLQYMPFSEKNSKIFAVELKNVTFSNVLGQGLCCLSQGVFLTIGFLIFGIGDAFFWGTVTVFLSFLPIIGPQLVFVPASLIAFSYGNTYVGAGILIWGFVVVTNIDNFVRFMISQKIADTHPLVTVIGVVIGLPVFGIIGLVIGPLLLSYFMLLVKMYETTYIDRQILEKNLLS
jgi:predicted PurR-regulated permease PerM